MTKEQAIEELTRCAEICPSTSLAEACRMAGAMINEDRDCGNCKYTARTAKDAPCRYCNFKAGDKWEPKEVDNGQTN